MTTNRPLLITLMLSGALLAPASGAESAPILEDSFDRAELGDGWHINTGEWKIVDGVMHAHEIPADQHSAAARRSIQTTDATYEMRFRFTGEGKAFHFGFDPAKGELKKRGHLFSVIVTPGLWKILKHVDKDRPEEDPNETLTQEKFEFETGEWYTLRVTTEGTKVVATINGEQTLETSHPTFGVKKPALVFRCLGDGVEVDDVKVWGAGEGSSQ